jgi:transposase
LLDVERWAEIRRMCFVERLSIREIARRTGHDRKTVQRAIRSDAPPSYRRAPAGSKLDPFKDEIERLPGTRVRELPVRVCVAIAPPGFKPGTSRL